MARAAVDLDEVDRRILAVLAADGRVSVNELASRAAVSRATAYARLDRLRSSGVITGFRAELDPEALGFGVTAIVLVNVNQGEWPSVRAELSRLPGVEHVALTSGSFDFLLTVRATDIHSLRDVVLLRLQGLRAVRSTQTVFILDEEPRRSPIELLPPR